MDDLVTYVNYRKFAASSSKDAGDVTPSFISFVPAEASPIGKRFMRDVMLMTVKIVGPSKRSFC